MECFWDWWLEYKYSTMWIVVMVSKSISQTQTPWVCFASCSSLYLNKSFKLRGQCNLKTKLLRLIQRRSQKFVWRHRVSSMSVLIYCQLFSLSFINCFYCQLSLENSDSMNRILHFGVSIIQVSMRICRCLTWYLSEIWLKRLHQKLVCQSMASLSSPIAVGVPWDELHIAFWTSLSECLESPGSVWCMVMLLAYFSSVIYGQVIHI